MESAALRVDLEAIRAGGAVSRLAARLEPPWDGLARWGGSALGLAALRAVAAEGRAPCLALAVGEGVRRGLPTAARAVVLGRAPLSGRYAEGHVGGSLGPRLASLCDALVLSGRAGVRDAVLVLEEGDGGVHARLVARPDLSGRAPAERARVLEDELGPCAVLAIGAAGERGVPFASLASGHSPPSFVGRGGLGALFGELGLLALCVRAPLVAAAQDAGAFALRERLARSPRLAARAAGGTLELFDALAVRGELDADVARGIGDEARERADARHGCRGCPTPCGWVFERSDGARQGARFGASHALGVALGLDSLDDALALLGACDALGVDAKEAGAVLGLLGTARARGLLPGPDPRGDRAALQRELERLVHDDAAPGRRGVALLARELGLADEVPVAHGQALRPERSRAALLGQHVGSGGADPMRTFPFLLESADPARVRALVAPLALPPDALDPDVASGKGRLVYWHENLVASVDLSGFCSFSTAGLLGDGLASLDELAGWILPHALRAPDDPGWARRSPGERLLAAGAGLVAARLAWNEELGAADGSAAAALATLAEPGMLDEHRALRGLDPRGRLLPETRARIGRPEALRADLPLAEQGDPGRPTEVPVRRELGRVTLRAGGALGDALGRERELELELPARLDHVLARLAREDAALGPHLLDGERVVPAVWRAGRRLAREDAVRAGDRLDLVLTIAGG